MIMLQSEQDYDNAINRVEYLDSKSDLSELEKLEMEHLCNALYAYELLHYPIKEPETWLDKFIDWVLIKFNIT